MIRLLCFLLLLLSVFTSGPVLAGEGAGKAKGPSATLLAVPTLPPFPGKSYSLQLLDLSQVLVKVLGDSPSILISRKEVEVRYARRLTVLETFFPVATVGGGTATYSGEIQNTTGQFSNVTKQSAAHSQGLFLTVNPLVSSFRTQVATTDLDRARSLLSETENQKLSQAAALYFETLASYSKIAVLSKAVSLSTLLYQEEKRLVALGGASIVGVLRTAHEIARNSRLLVAEETTAYQLSFRLGQILGEGPPVLPAPAEKFLFPRLYLDPQDNLPHLLALADRNRPLLAAYRQNLLAKKQRFRQVLYGPVFPNLAAGIVNGALGPDFNTMTGMNQTIATAFWNIGPGGLLDPGALLLAKRKILRQDAVLSREEFVVHRQVGDSYEAFRKAGEEEAVALEDVRLAKMTFDATQIRVRLGLYHALELIISLRDLIHAQLRYVGVVSDYETAQFRLMAAIGVRPDLVAVSRPRAVPGMARPNDAPPSHRDQSGGVR